MIIVRVALDLPLHRCFDYLAPAATAADVGRRVRVPFGRRSTIGVIVELPAASEFPPEQLKPVEAILPEPVLPADWFRLCEFCAAYYQAPLGEVMLSTLPAGLKRLDPPQARPPKPAKAPPPPSPAPALTAEQAAALAAVRAAGPGFHPFLLFGVTGSGKTEVYLRLIADALEKGGQALVLVPEINLTPQLEARVAARFPGAGLVSLHSELTEAARLRNWQAAHSGRARIVLGTRLAVFAPLSELALIIVDEEHDPSFKQQDGMRYSARDVAVFRARDGKVPIVLGSATPSLESWANATAPEMRGRYALLTLKERAVEQARLPAVQRIDLRKEKAEEGLSGILLEAIEKRLARGEQSLVFLNRRGYAPVLACTACGWISACRRCAANLVLHLKDRRLRCHHCGYETRIPKACPTCGNQDIHPFGRGTQRLEEFLVERFPDARILRADRDAAKSRKQWEALVEKIHAGEADILVGTQMLAKGHDFPKLTLVGVVGADAALFAADCRAPERLFAQLMQVAGRAGRAELPGEVLIQTQYPDHPLYAAVVNHDYPAFAATQLAERKVAGFPPYGFQAMLRAEAPQMADAIAFLASARAWPGAEAHPAVTLYDPVPMRLAKLANLERGQLLAESPSRPALQAFLGEWRQAVETIKAPSRLRWHLEVDPLEF
ncbi:primosomal protein N' [Azospira restricta]|uniref:Replication restart protein PriA n=1 Tax=Azospira restricta TaxID=404405 RepID=A0A974SQ84_9RHOO|nr:primosomal protein N' [Azospira restricta]QRJ64394.1 primosomal protein N' [Azospira restricta]